MKKFFALVLAVAMALSVCSVALADYPEKNVNGIIQWGEGGGTDVLMRPLASLAEKDFGASIVCQNMTGGTGSIAVQYVSDQEADGYNLLMGAENAPLYQVLGISELTYADFDCVYLIGDETVGIVVPKDSPYNSFTDIVNAALAEPESVTLSTTGKGGLPWEVGSFITSVTGATFNQIPYDSDKSALTAVMGGECEFTVCKVMSGRQYAESGDIKFLCMFSKDEVAALPGVPSILAEYPAFEQYLPWGPFYGVFVKKGTDASIIEKLSAAFSAAGQDPSYQEVLANRSINFKGYTGAEAEQYITAYSANTIGALKTAGAID
ncbi:MAG: tripartite tricarboxylate transporter substrate binding protein [Clostridia bacterium]|nr:tripartite tricarboxylate transporter substrate binding protein [Clostridia bacterium]